MEYKKYSRGTGVGGGLASEETRPEAAWVVLFVEAEAVPLAVKGFAHLYAVVDRPPVGKTSEATVIEEEVSLELAGEALARGIFFGEVAVDGVELYTTLAAPFDGFVEEDTFADGPEDEAVSFACKHCEGLGGEGNFFADLRVAVTHDGAVEVYCDSHLSDRIVREHIGS